MSRWLLSGLLLLALAGAVSVACAAGLAATMPPVPLLLAVKVNGSEQAGVFQLLPMPDRSLAAAAEDIVAWHLTPPIEGFEVGGRRYHRLDAIAGATSRIDFGSQTLLLDVPSSAFAGTTFAAPSGAAPALTPSRPGGFFNYDLQWQRSGDGDSAGGLFEAGTFNRYGSGSVTGLWNTASPGRSWVRLDTAWTMDDLDAMRSLHLGDAIARSDSWSRSVRFGGIQWGTNFATRPDLIPFPLPGLQGEATLPSTLDVYVNNVQRLHAAIPPGPFDIPAVPLVTGQGQIQMVVTDLLGRQQVVTRPYYASSSLLRPGLHDFSVEAGVIREDYGIASDHYGPAMFVATDRLGVTPGFTREFRAEVLHDQQAVGAGGVWLWPRWGTFNLAAAASHGPSGVGRLLQAGTQRQARDVSLSVETTCADRDFVQLGSLAGITPRRATTASIGLPVGSDGFGIAYAHQTTWEGSDNRLLSASYSLRLGNFGFLGFYALHDFSMPRTTTIGLTLVHALDGRTSASADTAQIGGRHQTTLQLQRSLPAGNGFGFGLLTTQGQGPSSRYDANGIWRTERGDLSVDAGRFADMDYYRAGLSGGIAVLGGSTFVGRRIDDSFAVVKVGDFAGVRIYRDNQEIGRTDANGMILATHLLPYQATPIAAEQADLPLDADVEALQLRLVPALRTGVYAEIPVRRVRSAAFRLVDETGKPLPPGAVVRIEDEGREFPVGYDGRTFVSGLGPRTRLVAAWAGRRCAVDLPWAEQKQQVPDLGTVVCGVLEP
ncbi:MAG: fimbria/pilus outer membrane usher protein [Rhodocyclaceae bacterium]|nr:fimbria/pilus outer membrane usher protein [Rhodocyclaceae bacterium]